MSHCGVQVQGPASAEDSVARRAPQGVRGAARHCAAPAADDSPIGGAHSVAARQVLPQPLLKSMLRAGDGPGSESGSPTPPLLCAVMQAELC